MAKFQLEFRKILVKSHTTFPGGHEGQINLCKFSLQNQPFRMVSQCMISSQKSAIPVRSMSLSGQRCAASRGPSWGHSGRRSPGGVPYQSGSCFRSASHAPLAATCQTKDASIKTRPSAMTLPSDAVSLIRDGERYISQHIRDSDSIPCKAPPV